MLPSSGIHIQINEPELTLMRAAASQMGTAVEDWARGVLFHEAQCQLRGPAQDPESALRTLFASDAPVSSVDEMIAQSVDGRLS